MRDTLKAFLSAAVLVIAGAGCVSPAPLMELPTAPPAAPTEAAATEIGTGPAAREEGLEPYYIAYSQAQFDAALKEGRAVVLYFWAAWCPICKAEEPKISAWIEGSGLPVAGFRVNYDTESALKAEYRIPYQHTTVFLNAGGDEVERFSGPVDEATFMAALRKAAGK